MVCAGPGQKPQRPFFLHHGSYVQTFLLAGTLDPSLQDREGKPKRDISTILHILNDLLVASPQFRNQSACPQHFHGYQGMTQQAPLGKNKVYITKTCPRNIQRFFFIYFFFSEVKFSLEKNIFLIFAQNKVVRTC